MPAERAVARVDLAAIERNCAHLRGQIAGDAELCAVVKADGYGHGAVASARAALDGGATWLAVATAREAAELRGAELDPPLLVMGALTPADLDLAAMAGAEVVAWTPELADAAVAAGLRVHVKYDSGMGRLGTADPDEARALVERVAASGQLGGLMTHFATADERGDDHFPAQLERFGALAEQVRAEHPDAVVHAANSAATLRDPRAHFDLVRCGIAVYGLDPFQEDPAARGLDPALTLTSYVSAIKRFEPGTTAGYGRTWAASEPTWVGVLPIGYGDGWRRGLSNEARVLIGGRSHPLVGTVSMDNVTVDLGPETGAEVGDEAVLIGAQGEERILAEEVAAALGTINYEVTCGLTQRVRREHG
ncbi:MAG TPA: alanine racemase [Thermoleophilaceae bacterium]